jgi:hypothetical protein
LLDYETAISHNVTVQVTDAAGNSYSEVMAIAVDNVDDQPRNLQAVPGISEANIIGYYSFTSPDALGRDEAGDDSPITLFGSPTQTTSPVSSEALDLAGGVSGQYGNIAGITTGGAMTMAGWVKFDTTSGGGFERVFDFGQPIKRPDVHDRTEWIVQLSRHRGRSDHQRHVDALRRDRG